MQKKTKELTPKTRVLTFTPEERTLINKAVNSIEGMKIYKPVFYHDAIIEKAKRMLGEAE